MHPMEGSKKLPEPKTTRHANGAARPIRALQCCRSFSHWLRKITVNMAVITKFTPSVLKGSTEPTTAPRPALATQ